VEVTASANEAIIHLIFETKSVFCYLFKMKWSTLCLILLAGAIESQSQIIFRNDFVIGRHHKLKNKGLSFITINLDRYPNLNMLVNGRGGRSIVVDVQALRQPNRVYSYNELAEKIYTPAPVYKASVPPVPMFLLMPPPFELKYGGFKLQE
jgi:hypothetical protein